MANLNCSVTTEGEIGLVANTPKTILQLVAPTNQRLDMRSIAVAFDGVSTTSEPITVELLRQTTAGTMTAASPVKDSAGAETVQATAQKNASVEPTSGDVLRRFEIHAQDGIVLVFDKREMEVGGGTRIAIRCTVPSGGASINTTGHITWEE